jgi:hypothetical protein
MLDRRADASLPAIQISPDAWLTRTFERSVAILFSLTAVGMIVALLCRAMFHVTRNFNEGWNAYHATDVFLGRALYPPPDALIGNNYPPLSFVLTALVMHVVPDAVFAGRVLAMAAFVLVTLLIGLIIHAQDGDKPAALVGGAAFAVYLAVNSPNYPGMDDPQMLAHAILLSGGYLLLSGRGSRNSVIAAALLMAAGLFVKHNLIALPLAATIWLTMTRRATGLLFVTCLLLAGGFGLAVSTFAFGPDFIHGLMAPRQVSLGKAWHDTLQALTPMKGLLVLALLSVALAPRDRLSQFLVLYLAIALAVGGLAAAGAGVSDNAFYELAIACAIAAGHLVTLARRTMLGMPTLRLWLICAVTVAALCDNGLATAKDMLLLPSYLATQRSHAAETEALVAAIADRPGPALCRTPVFCYWAGKPFEFDTFKFFQGLANGTVRDTPLKDRLAHRDFAIIVLDQDDPDLLPPPLMAVLQANYALAPETYPHRLVYLPKPVAS